MNWLMWRLQRTELALLAAILTAPAAIFAIWYWNDLSGPDGTYWTMCASNIRISGSDCAGPWLFYWAIVNNLPWMNVIPPLAAVLLALPVVSELSNGTYRLAWTQGVNRGQWTRRKMLALTAAGAVAALIMILDFQWFDIPYGSEGVWYREQLFDLEGVLPLGHTLFAIGLMLSIGALVQRTLVTIFLGGLVYVATRLAFVNGVRPGLHPAEKSVTLGFRGAETSDDQWTLSYHWIDAAGNRVPESRLYLELCPGEAFIPERFISQMDDCVRGHGISFVRFSHPESHFWPLQLIETGMFLAAAAALIGFAAWYILRRVE
jgi:hypothetical protein